MNKHLILLTAIIGIALLLQPLRIGYYNLTASAPKGLYRITTTTPLERGQLVTIKIPDSVKENSGKSRWNKVDTPLLKQIGGLPGDEVKVTDDGFFVNNEYIGPVFKVDKHGEAMPMIRGTFIIPPNMFLPISHYEKSFDGRYFGTLPFTSIENHVTPLLTY